MMRDADVAVEWVLCTGCMGGALPFQGIASGDDYEGALREYRWGLRSRAGDFMGTRFDPFDDEIRGILRGIDGTLRGCAYFQGDEVAGRLAGLASDGGCSMSLLFHNIRSAKGANLELLEAEMRMWMVPWDVVGLAETWLDAESEKRVGLEGYVVECASRQDKGGGGVALFIKEGLTYKTRPDLGIFEEGEFESVFVEINRGGGRRNDVVGVVYRPPRAALSVFNERMAQLLGKLGGVNGYIMGDFNADLIKTGTNGPTAEFLGTFTSGGYYPLVSLPTRLTDETSTLIDNIFTNNLGAQMEAGLVKVRVSDHLPIFAMVGGPGRGGQVEGAGRNQKKDAH